MSRGQVLYLHITVALTAITGVVFALMKYFMKPAGDFSVLNHPLQPYMLAAHVVVSPLLVFGFGWVFANHVRPNLAARQLPKRTSGIWSLAAIVPMTLSGYLLQVSSSDAIRKAMAVAHWITSGLFVIVYFVHLFRRPVAAGGRSAVEGDAVNVPSPT